MQYESSCSCFLVLPCCCRPAQAFLEATQLRHQMVRCGVRSVAANTRTIAPFGSSTAWWSATNKMPNSSSTHHWELGCWANLDQGPMPADPPSRSLNPQLGWRALFEHRVLTRSCLAERELATRCATGNSQCLVWCFVEQLRWCFRPYYLLPTTKVSSIALLVDHVQGQCHPIQPQPHRACRLIQTRDNGVPGALGSCYTLRLA